MIKFAFTVATPDVSSKTILAYTGPMEESIPELADLGYDGVELMVRCPQEFDAHKIETLIGRYGLAVPVVGTGQLAGEDRLTLTDPDPSVREAAVARFKDVVDFAARFGARINVGRFRGQILDGIPPQVSLTRMKDGLARILDYAAQHEIAIILEPQNRSVINVCHTVSEALALIAELERDNFGTMVDTFHANIEERSIAAAMVWAGDRLWYVHVSDSNRLAPGKGHLNFPDIIEVLKALGYQGFVTAEILQKPDHSSAARQAIDYLRTI